MLSAFGEPDDEDNQDDDEGKCIGDGIARMTTYFRPERRIVCRRLLR